MEPRGHLPQSCDVTIAADGAWIAKEYARKHKDDPTAAIDYTRAAAELDVAKATAKASGADELFVMGAESQGETDAMKFLEERAAERAAREMKEEEE